jgi:hypothetical protein
MARSKGNGGLAALAGILLAGVAFVWWAKLPKTTSTINTAAVPPMPDFSKLPINSQSFPSLNLGPLMPMPDWSNLPINAQPPMPYVTLLPGVS